MICPVCRGTSFYEDDSGDFYCSRCNTQSQELFAESFDVEDALENRQDGGPNFTRVKRPRARKGTLNLVEIAPIELEVLLQAYQWCLRLLAEKTAELAALPRLVDQVWTLWRRYLLRWRASGRKLRPAFFSYLDSYDDFFSDDYALPHPMLPTKYLLFGFVDLAARQLGSGLIPADLVRWAFEGRLPFANFVGCLPDELKDQLGRWGGALLAKGDYLTTTNVFFHTCMLAESLGITVPFLNSPLVARSIIAALGLPKGCWTAFCAMTQMFRRAKPLPSLDFLEEHYPERIMAACICAMKLQRNWTSWEYVIAADRAQHAIVPTHISELDSIPRKDMDHLFSRLHDSMPPRPPAATVKSHNAAVASFLEANTNICRGRLEVRETAVRSPVALSSDSILHRRSTAEERRLLFKLERLPDPRGHFQQDARLFGPYVHYVETLEDITGLVLPQYAVLLERCARYLCSSPGLLHLLVQRIDKTVIALMHEREKARQVCEVEAVTARYSTLLSRRKLARKVELASATDCMVRMKRLRRGLRPSISWLERLQHHYRKGLPYCKNFKWSSDENDARLHADIKKEGESTLHDDQVAASGDAVPDVRRRKAGSRRGKKNMSLRPMDTLSKFTFEVRRRRSDMRRREFRLPPRLLRAEGAREKSSEGMDVRLADLDDSGESEGSGSLRSDAEEEEDTVSGGNQSSETDDDSSSRDTSSQPSNLEEESTEGSTLDDNTDDPSQEDESSNDDDETSGTPSINESEYADEEEDSEESSDYDDTHR